MKIITTILILIAFSIILTWSPWLGENEIHDKVLREKGRIDGTIDKKGNLVCDYEVIRFPFGRFVASCEGGWYVTFWGKIF